MIDWFILLAPLAAFAVIFLLAFLGCTGRLYESPYIKLTLWIDPARLTSGTLNRIEFKLEDLNNHVLYHYPQTPPFEITGGEIFILNQFRYSIPPDHRWKASCLVWLRDNSTLSIRQLEPLAGAICEFNSRPSAETNVTFIVDRRSDRDEFENVLVDICP